MSKNLNSKFRRRLVGPKTPIPQPRQAKIRRDKKKPR